MDLQEFVSTYSDRGQCKCGRCIDVVADAPSPNGTHTANLEFFEVCLKGEPKKEKFEALVKAHKGVYGDCDLFDGKEHNYMELGGWIGDQGLALMMMGMGSLLGVWSLMTPSKMLGDSIPAEMKMQMAGMGMVTVKAHGSAAT